MKVFALLVLVFVTLVAGQHGAIEPLEATLDGSSIAVLNISSQTVGVEDQKVVVKKATMGGVEAHETNVRETPSGRVMTGKGSGQLEGFASQYSSGSDCNTTLTKINMTRSRLNTVHGQTTNPPRPVKPKPPCPLSIARPRPMLPRRQLRLRPRKCE